MTSRICLNEMSFVDHLKTSVPSGLRILMHSSNPFLMSADQFSESFPYFLTSQLFFPAFNKCGGSNMTRLKESSSKGMFLKSATISGATFNVRPSHNVSSISLLSIKTCQNETFCFRNIHQLLFLPLFRTFFLFVFVIQFRRDFYSEIVEQICQEVFRFRMSSPVVEAVNVCSRVRSEMMI